jgi:hypothetical protein
VTDARHRNSVVILVAAAALAMAMAPAADASEHPDWRGQWIRIGPNSFDPTRPPGLGQRAPLTAEYQAVLEASLADQAAGALGNNPAGGCVPVGMPRMMIGYQGGMEFVITPGVTYVLMLEPTVQIRHIYTDGRTWPAAIAPSFSGYAIGAWSDPGDDGRYRVLSVETRAIRGPRSYDSSGIPFHRDNATIVKERISLERGNRNILFNEITVIDGALTRPWTVTRSYIRDRQPLWIETDCNDEDFRLRVGNELYFKSGDGALMPTRKNQPPPDLRHFNRAGER